MDKIVYFRLTGKTESVLNVIDDIVGVVCFDNLSRCEILVEDFKEVAE